MDVEEPPPFPLNDLPADLQHIFLLQVFQQLDQADLHGTIPLVCKQWAQLAAEACRSLEVELKTEAAVDSLVSWIICLVPGFTLLEVKITLDRLAVTSPWPDRLLNSLTFHSRLHRLFVGRHPHSYRRQMQLQLPILHFLPALTSLALDSVYISATNQESLMQLSQLRSLSLVRCQLWYDEMIFWGRQEAPSLGPFLLEAATSLTHLSSLEAQDTFPKEEDMSCLTALTSLKELRLWGLQLCDMDMRERLPLSLPLTAISLSIPTRYHSSLELRSMVTTWLQPHLARTLHTVGLQCSKSRGSRLVLPELFAALAGSGPQLRSLSLQGVDAHGELDKLTALTQLTQLELEFCGLHNSEVTQLSTLTGLQCLSLADNKRIKGHDGSVLTLARTLTQLTTLTCSKKADAVIRRSFGHRITASEAHGLYSTQYTIAS
jgi:hypothetical protein